jgi:acyl-[acyl-carrier-protein]-phospholipid O-acyltransferase / long-chain-fatty-acid--[acyl-carrier-protein] ligase
MTTDDKVTREQFLRYARGKGAPELIVPAEVLLVDRMPLLGSGKPDYVAALAMAKEKATAASPMASQPAA